MTEAFFMILLSMLGVYFACGFVFAIFFVAYGAGKIDHDAKGIGLGLRLLLFPGSVAFWVILLRKWIKAAKEK